MPTWSTNLLPILVTVVVVVEQGFVLTERSARSDKAALLAPAPVVRGPVILVKLQRLALHFYLW